MTDSERTDRSGDGGDDSRIDAWPATTSTEPSVIIERVKNAVEQRHGRGEALDTATEDVVEDLAGREPPDLREEASNWIAIVDSDPASAEAQPRPAATDGDVDLRDAIRSRNRPADR